MDISKIKNEQAKYFAEVFFTNRGINREYYKRLPEDKYDFRMVDREDRKSDTPRESIAHQINVQKNFMSAIRSGKLAYGEVKDSELKHKSKRILLKELKRIDEELIDILSDESNLKQKIIVPWSKEKVGTIDMLWALNNHEVLHTGWNIAVMDHVGMERFEELKKVWG